MCVCVCVCVCACVCMCLIVNKFIKLSHTFLFWASLFMYKNEPANFAPWWTKCYVLLCHDSHSHKPEVAPHLLQQVVKVPLVVSRDGHTVGDFVDDVQFLHQQYNYKWPVDSKKERNKYTHNTPKCSCHVLCSTYSEGKQSQNTPYHNHKTYKHSKTKSEVVSHQGGLSPWG